MRRKKFNLIREYKKGWGYIRGSKNYIFLSIGIFFLFFLVGFFIPAPEILKSEILKIISEITEKTQGMSQGELIWFIFSNNLQSSFLGIFFGAVLGLVPIFSSVFNGYLLGFVSFYAVKEQGIFSLWRIFPHGIFELPAIFISFGLGIKLGTFIFAEDRWVLFRKYLRDSFRVFLLFILPLLIIAAIIEGTLIFLFS